MSRKRGHRYGAAHQQIRRHFLLRMGRGEVFSCWRCGDPIAGRWDLGHVEAGVGVWIDFDGLRGRWPEHPRCNRQTVTHLKERLARAEASGG